MLKFKKPSVYIGVAAGILTCIIGFSLLTNPDSLNMSESIIPQAEDMDGTSNMEPFNYSQAGEFARQYGFESGLILKSDNQKTKLLLYNSLIDSKDDLKAKIITLNNLKEIENEQNVYFPGELQGYFLSFKFGDSTEKKHLLGYRSVVDHNRKKLYSDLLVFYKDDLEKITILQSYEQTYDESKGIVPQGIIPTVIDFSVDMLEDYVIYEDKDLSWKVQDVRTGDIYDSEENNPMLTEVEPYYAAAGEYIYILKYIKDNSILAFNTNSKEFQILKQSDR